MNCREVIDFLQRYFDDELALEQRAAFEHHLTLCSDCVEYLSNYQQSIALGQAALRSESTADLPPELIQAVLHSLKQPGRERGPD